MKLEEALERIYSMHQFDIKLGLEKITHLMNHLGNPHKYLNSFHVGGSNGKGSTSSFLASILQEAGYKVGLFTSPHFVKFNERVRINGKQIPDDYIIDFINEMDSYIRKHQPTFFEITTAMAFKYFYESNPDYTVFEVGLGGRLDATNIINPVASVITSISLEHTNILGNDLRQIAIEKAGIIKNNSKVFIGKLPSIAESEISAKAKEQNSSLFSLKNFIQDNNDFVRLRLKENVFNLYNTPLPGHHQLLNSSLAVLTLKETINPANESILAGIRKVKINSGLQGRYDLIHNNPAVIMDAAHNLEGVSCFINEFRKTVHDYKKRTLIFGVMKDKEYIKMIELLSPYFDEIRFSSIFYERAVTADELLAVSRDYHHNIVVENEPEDFIENFIKKNKDECLVLIGSIYLLGKIKENLGKKGLDIFY